MRAGWGGPEGGGGGARGGGKGGGGGATRRDGPFRELAKAPMTRKYSGMKTVEISTLKPSSPKEEGVGGSGCF